MKFDILFYGQYNTISKILFSKIVYFQEQLNDVFYFFKFCFQFQNVYQTSKVSIFVSLFIVFKNH